MATSDSKPNPEQVTRIKIVTWNPNGSPVALEDKLSEQLWCRIRKAFVCEQELRKSSFEKRNRPNLRHKEKGAKTYQAVFIPESGSVYDYSDISDVCNLSELRCSGMRVIHKQTKKGLFILVSFHGEYKETKQTKEGTGESFNDTQEDFSSSSDSVYVKNDKLELFINEMIKLANLCKLAVIVGGDFNYYDIKWKTEIEKEYRGQVVVAPLYAGVPNRRHTENVIDTFIAVYPDDCKNVVTCKFHTPIPICMLPTTGYVGDDETKFLNYPNDLRPFCKVLYYNNKDLQTLKTILKSDNLEESYKDNKTDAILPLWPKCEILKNFNHDPVMVTVELVSTKDEDSPSEEQVSV